MNIQRSFARLTAVLLGAATLLGGCAGSDGLIQTTNVLATPPIPFEQALLDQVNAYRARLGLKSLVMHDVLTKQARIHSTNMAKGKVRFGHDGFKQRADNIRSYLSVIEISENLAVNRGYADPVAVAFETLMASPGHRKNIVGSFDMTGIGVSKTSDGTIFFTQIFADGAGRFR